MSKTVGKILAVAAIVVGVIAAVPTLGASLGLSAAAASLIGVGIAAATFVNSAILASKAKGQIQARQASVVALQFGEVAREGLLGQALTGGSLADAFNWGGAHGTDWECRVIALVDHLCDGLVGFYVNDAFVTYSGDGPVPGYNGQLEVYWRPGTMDQTVPAVVLANGPGWLPSDNGAGVAWVAVCYKADKADTKTPVWPGGRPSFSWLVRGKRCYQARKDSSVGGFGPHRWTNPATWEWTDNLVDCRYNWVRGIYAGDRVTDPGMLLVGRGLTEVEAPPVNVFAPANLCDELVAIDAGGTEKRYTVNGVVKADETYIDVEEHFAAACGGVILQPEGAVEIEPGQAKAPVFFFSDEDLLVGSTVEFSDTLSEADEAWVNTVSPRYIEPALKFTDHAAPVRRVMSDVIIDGGPREQSLSLALVTSGTQAGRVGEIARRLGRLPARGKVTLGPTFAEVEEGDWGVWTSQRYLKGKSVLFRVDAYSLDAKWHNTLTLREISPLVYARDADKASTSIALQPGDIAPIGQPGASAWAAQAVSLTKGDVSVPAIAITGATDNDYADLVRFELLDATGVTDPAVAGGWSETGVAGPDVRQHLITTVAPLTPYYVAVSYMVGRRPGPRRILGPIQTDAGATDWETVQGPKKPDDNATNSKDPASPFGPTGTVSDALGRIKANEAAVKEALDRHAYIDTVTIPAITKRIDDANADIAQANDDIDAANKEIADNLKAANDAFDAAGKALDDEIERAKTKEGVIVQSVLKVVTDYEAADAATSARITSEVGTLSDADTALGRRIDKVVTDYEAADTATGTRITTEVTALSDADKALGQRIDTVTTDYKAGDTATGTRITTEVAALSDADTALGRRIDKVVTDYEAADTATGTRITTEVTALSDADKALGQRIDTVTTDYKAADTATGTRITNEVTALSNADTALGQRIDTVTTDYKAADTATGTRITTEVTALSNADTALGQRIDTVTTDYKAADTATGTRITNEVTALSNADTALGQRIDTVTTDYKAADTATGTRITNEVTALSNADTAIGQRIDTVTADYKAADTATSARITREVTAVSDATGAVARDVSTLSGKVDGFSASISEAKGIAVGADGRTSVYWEITGSTSDGMTSIRLSKKDGARPVFYVGADLVVDGNILTTGSVTTLKIARGAVTAPYITQIVSRGEFYSYFDNVGENAEQITDWQEVISVDVATSGDGIGVLINPSVAYDFGASADSGFPPYMKFALMRDGGIIWGPSEISGSTSHSSVLSFSTQDTPSTVGTTNYRLVVKIQHVEGAVRSSGRMFANFRNIAATVFKR